MPLVLLPVGAAGVVALVVALLRPPFATMDSQLLVIGTDHQLSCLGQARFTECRALFEHRLVGMDWFPLFQHVPDAALAGLRLSGAARLRGLGWVSVASFVGVLLIGVRSLRREGLPRLGALFALACLAGPLLFYVHSAFGEMLAALLVVGLAAAALRPERAWVVGITALVASLTKETAAPFVFAIGVLALDIARTRRPVEVRRAALALVLGTLSGLLVAMLYNVFRFGTVENPVYSFFASRGPSPTQSLVFLGGLLAAPNAGVLWFWPAAVAVLLAATVAPFLRRSPPVRWHAAAALAIFVAFELSLSTWWAPYGWFAWGPRLTVPWVPALLLLALAGSGPDLEPVLDRALRTPRRVAAAAGVLWVAALPHLGGLMSFAPLRDFFAHYRAYPGGAGYYRLVDEYAFGRFPVLLSALRGLVSPGGVVLAAALLWLSAGLTRAAAPPPRPLTAPAPAPASAPGDGRPDPAYAEGTAAAAPVAPATGGT